MCFVIGLPLTSYIEDAFVTAEDNKHRRDSHWFLPIESPTNASLRFLSLSNIVFASNLYSCTYDQNQKFISFHTRESSLENSKSSPKNTKSPSTNGINNWSLAYPSTSLFRVAIIWCLDVVMLMIIWFDLIILGWIVAAMKMITKKSSTITYIPPVITQLQPQKHVQPLSHVPRL